MKRSLSGFLIIFSIALAGRAQERVLQQELLAYLPLANDLQDHSQQKHLVEVHGHVELSNGSARFAGDGSWLELPNLPFDRAFSITLWIKPEGSYPAFGLVEQREDGTRNHHLHLMLRGELQPYLGFYVNDAISPTSIPSNEWTHLVFQYTGKHQQIWINGRLICERAAEAYAGCSGITRIGKSPRWSNVPSRDFHGLIRELRIYGRALSFAEILALTPATRQTASVPVSNPSGTKLAQTSTDNAADSTPLAAIPFLSIEKYDLVVTGAPGQIYTLLATTNLAASWQPLATLTNVNGHAEFTDTEAPKFNERFYRILLNQQN